MTRREAASDESGAVAVVVALLTIVLFACGAVAIDLGNAYSRVRSVQADADFAALSVGDLLPATTAAEKLAVANRVADYLEKNQAQDDRPGGAVVPTPAELLSSGMVTFPTPAKVVVKTPAVQVDYGLARVIGFESTEVARSATVQVEQLSGALVAPLYAVAGCDYGVQILKDSPNGHAPSTAPTLPNPGATTNQISIDTVSPATRSVSDPPPVLDLTGDFKSNGSGTPRVDQVGFFSDTGTGPSPHTVLATPANVTDTTLKVQVPANVMQEGVWYLRVSVIAQGKWSDVNTAATFIVGEAATPSCPASSSGGNFGQLGFGDVSNPNDDIAHVLIHGPNHNVTSYPGSLSPAECGGLGSPAVHYPTEDANCVSTEPGFKPTAVTDGLINGYGGDRGRLDKNTTPLCGSSRTPTTNLNNDNLTCFFTNPTTTIATIANPSYAGPTVISADIFTSPRFFFVPVFSAEPATGKKEYKIAGFRPAFLTEQPTTAKRGDGSTATNGVIMGSNGKVSALNFVLFSDKALPESIDAGPPTNPTYSFGPKVITLVN